MTTHLNVATTRYANHPEWRNDCIGACDVDDGEDSYTTDPSAVTCAACEYEILAPRIDAGEVCPHCRKGGYILRERAMGMPIFRCTLCNGPGWFDHTTMECEGEAA